jgi:hypothetical protein
MPYALRVTWAEGQYQGTSPTTISPATPGNAVAAGGGQAAIATSIVFGVGDAAAAGSLFGIPDSVPLTVGNAEAAGSTGSVSIYSVRVTWAEAQYEALPGEIVNATPGNAQAGGPVGATVSENVTLETTAGNAVAAGLAFGLTNNTLINFATADAFAAGQRCEILPPLTVAPSATPGYAPRTRYRVRVGSRWMEVDPLDAMSVRRAYDAAQEDAQDAATQDVEAPAAVAAQAVVVQPIKGPDYAGLAKEARRISEDIRKVYADALQTALIARLMREQIERDDEDDIAVLLASI